MIAQDRVQQFIDFNQHKNVRLFDENFIRILMLICFGAKKIKEREFHPDVLNFIQGTTPLYSIFST